MNTKKLIKQAGLELFNREGISTITLRHVAKTLNKSYGNITYHYNTKELLILAIYQDMTGELKKIGTKLQAVKNPFYSIFDAPKLTFDLSLQYLFLFKDYIEIKRKYPAIFQAIELSNNERKKGFQQLLLLLQQQGFFNADLTKDDFDYLMELSGAMRTFFFLNLSTTEYASPNLKGKYLNYTNRLILPYLTSKGKKEYSNWQKNTNTVK